MWKDIKGYEGLYQVSDNGEVKSLTYRNRLSPRILKQYFDGKGGKGKGYLSVYLHNDNNEIKRYRVNRLVALHFVDNPQNLPLVMHLDDNKTNNYYKNLKWGDDIDNQGVKIQQFTKDGKYLRTFIRTIY